MSFEFIVSLVSALGGGTVVLALVRIMQTRQDTNNALAITNDRELAQIRAELWARITSLETEIRANNERYEREMKCLRDEIDVWQRRYFLSVAVSDQQTKIIEKLQDQIDDFGATNDVS